MKAVSGVLWLVLMPSLVVAQSSSDADHKDGERKKAREAGAKPKVYTAEDLAAVRAREPKPAVNPPAKAPKVPKEATSESPRPRPPDPRGDEDAWRRRVAGATERRDAAKKRYDELNSLSLAPGEYYVDENGEPLITSLGQLRSMIAQAKAEYDLAEKALEDLLEEARQADVPPGWLR